MASKRNPLFHNQPVGVSAEAQDREPAPIIKLPSDAFFVSEVVDAKAHLGTMFVMAAGSGIVQAVALTSAGNGVLGPMKIGAAYPVHTKVVCFHPPGSPICYVLGSLPDYVTSNTFNKVPDVIVPGSRVGINHDRAHRTGLERPNGISGEINFADGRPLDELPGDYGYINELGLSFGLGRIMAWLRASHFCGVEAFWVDNLLRLTGYNFEVQTSASELRAVNDQGEFNELLRWGPYPWETTGVIDPQTDFTTKGGNGADGRVGREPIEDDQAGLWRVQRFRGYLGDLEKTIVSLPLRNALQGDVETMSADTKLPGVFEQGYGIDGQYHVRSAKGILLEKTVAIPVPKEKIAPDDPTGDTEENYKAAGVWGNGDDHERTEPVIDEDQAGMRSLLAWERHALFYGYYQNMGFAKHTKDWLLPEESEAASALGFDNALYSPDTALDPKTFWMPLPKHVDLDVDHRGQARYYAGRSFFQIEDDGSIIIEDAYGSQIRMEGGNIFLSARNDVVMQPGRNVQMWAPHDAVIKSGNSTDISCSKGDMRLKAEGNLMMLANTKGVLIESAFEPGIDGDEKPDWSSVGEDVESRGVLIKALNSSVISMSKDAYFRAGATEDNKFVGQLHMDAGAGDGEAFIHGREITSRARQRAQMIVGSTGENTDTSSFEFNKYEFVVGGKELQSVVMGSKSFVFGNEDGTDVSFSVMGDIYTKGNIVVNEAAYVSKNITGGKSLIAQEGIHSKGNAIITGVILCKNIAADDSTGFLAPTGDNFNAEDNPPPEHPTFGEKIIDAEEARSQGSLRSTREDDNQLVFDLIEELYGQNSKFASDELIADAVFSFRTPEQYGTDIEFKWYETRWQEMNRKLLQQNKVWEEVAVRAPGAGKDTMPYPGYEVWEEREMFVTLDNNLFDFSTGTAKKRADIEDDKTFGETNAKTFKGSYVVTAQQFE